MVPRPTLRLPATGWLGAGWVVFDGRFPNKHDVDPISPKHPVMLINQGGHFAVVNSLALEMAGVNASTKESRQWHVPCARPIMSLTARL